MKNEAILITSTALLLSGCASTVWVEKQSDGDSSQDVSGIPFYTKKEVFQHTTKWAQVWANVSLKVEKRLVTDKENEDWPAISQAFSKQMLVENLSELKDVKRMVLSIDHGDSSAISQIIDGFLSIEGVEDPSSVAANLVGNEIAPTWVVDGENTYYLNAPLPWFGTGSLTQELASDGTLTKVVSAPDTKLAEGLSSLIPFNEYLTGLLVTPLASESNTEIDATLKTMAVFDRSLVPQEIKRNKQKNSFVYSVALQIEEIGYLYTFNTTYDSMPSSFTPLPFDTSSSLFVRSTITGLTVDKTKKNDLPPAIGFSGSITLPKEAGGK